MGIETMKHPASEDQVDRMMTTMSYIFGGVGAVIGGVAGAGTVGFPAAIAAIIIGGIGGAIIGSFIPAGKFGGK